MVDVATEVGGDGTGTDIQLRELDIVRKSNTIVERIVPNRLLTTELVR